MNRGDILSRVKARKPLAALSVAFITVLAYLPALRNDFVSIDDYLYITQNPRIEQLDLKFLKWAFTSFHAANWHPLTWISHALDYAVWGLNPMGHHLSGILLHGINTFLVAILITNLLEYAGRNISPVENEGNLSPVTAGAVAGLLFGLHPLHVESAAWASERKDVLYACFYLLSILAYLKYAIPSGTPRAAAPSAPGRKWYFLSLAFFLLSLLSKPMAVTLPLVLLILDIYPLERITLRAASPSSRSALSEKIPFMLLSLASSAVTLAAQSSGGAVGTLESFPLHDRILTGIRALAFYLCKMLVPTGLAPIYPYPEHISVSTLEYAGATAAIAGITSFCILMRKKQRVFPAAWGYYVATLLPVLGIVQVGRQAAADRYTYLPSLGPFLLAGVGISLFAAKIAPKRQNVFAISCLLVLSTLLFPLTIAQTRIWKNSLALWNKEISEFPGVSEAYRARGAVYGELGNYSQAISDLDKAIALDPTDSLSFKNRGMAFLKSGMYQEAIGDFRQAIRLCPQRAEYHNDLGIALGMLNDYGNALESFNTAIALDRSFAKAYYGRGIVYGKLGLNDQSLDNLRIAAGLNDKASRDYLRAKGIGW